jgi:uncharacterized protein (DUF934 family)
MANLIRHGRVESATWPQLDDEAALQEYAARDRQDGIDGVIVPFRLWREQQALVDSLGIAVGVLVRDDDDLDQVAAELPRIALVAVAFPRFTNGRGYSIARLLRGRYGYRGELRAVGDVMRDQLFYMQRVGFDAFELRADQDPAVALTAFADFTEAYQASTDRPEPLFRRRVA